MIDHMLRYNEELHIIILESIIEGNPGRERPRTCYVRQIIKNARIDMQGKHGENILL